MKKFLAVLLAVALLGVAGAAFAEDSAFSDKDTATEITVKELSLDKVVEIAVKKLATIEETSVGLSAGKSTSQDIIVKEYAGKKLVVAGLVELSADIANAEASFDLSFDKTYVGQKLTADIVEKGNASFDLTSKDVTPEAKVTTLSGSFDKGAEVTLAYVIDLDKVSADFADAWTEVKAKATKKVSTYVSPDILAEISKDLGYEVKTFTPEEVGALVSLDETALAAASKDAMGLLEVKDTAKAGNYVLAIDVTDEFDTASFDVTTMGVELSADYVVTAASAAKGFFDEAGKNVTTTGLTGKGYVVFEIPGGEAEYPVVTVDAKDSGSDDPETDDGVRSGKGSGGCNGGFAGIAVLALGLAALRRKAR